MAFEIQMGIVGLNANSGAGEKRNAPVHEQARVATWVPRRVHGQALLGLSVVPGDFLNAIWFEIETRFYFGGLFHRLHCPRLTRALGYRSDLGGRGRPPFRLVVRGLAVFPERGDE